MVAVTTHHVSEPHHLLSTMSDEAHPVVENRCWPCTIANTAMAALVAGGPLFAAIRSGETALVAVAAL